MLITLAASTFIVTAIEGAVIAEAIFGAVDGLPGRSPPAPARRDGVMETLIRLITGATERDHRIVRRRLRFSHHREHGGEPPRSNRGATLAATLRSLAPGPRCQIAGHPPHRTSRHGAVARRRATAPDSPLLAPVVTHGRSRRDAGQQPL